MRTGCRWHRKRARPAGGEVLVPARARRVRVVEYEIGDRDGKDEVITLVTSLTDLREAPAAALAAAYHKRWEQEGANAQLKTFLRGPGKILCSHLPPMAEQELWGYLLTHYAISALTCTAATVAGTDPDRGKPKRTIRVVRRRVADPAFPQDRPGSALEQVTADITSPRHLSRTLGRRFLRGSHVRPDSRPIMQDCLDPASGSGALRRPDKQTKPILSLRVARCHSVSARREHARGTGLP